MTTEIISDVEVNDPDNLIPYVELDEAIIRGTTLGMLDFSSEDCYFGSGAIALGTTFKSLTADQSVATAYTAFDAVVGGMLPAGGVGKRVTMPSTFKLAANVTEFVYIVWAKIPATGWPTGGSANRQFSLGGVLGNTTTNAQYGIYVSFNTSGAAVIINGAGPASASSAGVVSYATDTAWADGELHQFAVHIKRASGIVLREIYIDKTLKNSVSIADWTGDILVPSIDAHLGYPLQSFYNTGASGVYLGRPSIWDMSDKDLAIADILSADWEVAQEYLS